MGTNQEFPALRSLVSLCFLALVVLLLSLRVHGKNYAQVTNYTPRFKGQKHKPIQKEPRVFAQSPSEPVNAIYEQPKQWSLRMAPATIFFQWISLDWTYAISKQWSLGPSLILYNAPAEEKSGMFFPAMNGSAFGFNLNYYFRTYDQDGWYLGHHSFYETYSVISHGSKDGDKNEIDGFRMSAVGGYQWRWTNWNILFGGGAEFVSHRVNKIRVHNGFDTQEENESSSMALPYLELKVGFLF